jgi:NAD(P)H-dependent FMN reductase
MKITILSGSARAGNNTLRVAKALALLHSDCEIIDYQEYDLPSFADSSIQPENETPFQSKLIKGIQNCDLLIVLTPEYNWFPSAEIVQTVHLLANNHYKHIFDNKVVTTVGVSAGRGGRMPTVQLGYVFNKIFNFFDLNSIVSPRAFEAQEVTICINADGKLLSNEAFNAGLKSFLKYSLKVTKRWHASE